MKAKVMSLVTLLSTIILFLPTFLVLSGHTTNSIRHDQQTFVSGSAPEELPFEPLGYPGSGKGQGPQLTTNSRLPTIYLL